MRTDNTDLINDVIRKVPEGYDTQLMKAGGVGKAKVSEEPTLMAQA
jgi:hypothetical protein